VKASTDVTQIVRGNWRLGSARIETFFGAAWQAVIMATLDGIPLLPESESDLAPYYGDAPSGVRANMVTTVDGAGAFDGRTKAISGDADQVLLAYLRHHADAVLVGAATVQAERYGPVKLSAEVQAQRESDGYAATPPLVIVTAHATMPTSLRVFTEPGPRPIIATLQANVDADSALHEVADFIAVGDEEIEPSLIVAAIRGLGLHRILCEGGPYLLSTLIESDLVDDMCLTVSPYLAGSQPTTPQPASAREAPTPLRLRHVLTRDDLLYLRYSRPDRATG
jgi:riboflavin biosynthesis pyrimidine reductase